MRLNYWPAHVFALAFVYLDVGSAKAQAALAPDPRYVVNPIWIARPTAEDVARIFPPRMQTGPIGGEMAMICSVTDEGRLSPCKTLGEAPPGMGVGAAGLKLASKFRMRNADGAGAAVAGRLIVVPVTFRLAGKPVASTSFYPTGLSILVDPVRDGGSAQTIDCPSANAPTRKCALRSFTLGAPGPASELNRRVLALGKVEGISRTICRVGASRVLESCTSPEGLTTDQAKVFTEIVSLLRAPETTDDRTPVSGTVITDFDWAQIVAAIKVRGEAEATVLSAAR